MLVLVLVLVVLVLVIVLVVLVLVLVVLAPVLLAPLVFAPVPASVKDQHSTQAGLHKVIISIIRDNRISKISFSSKYCTQCNLLSSKSFCGIL